MDNLKISSVFGVIFDVFYQNPLTIVLPGHKIGVY